MEIRGLHHMAYRCRDSDETRRFYEDFLGLPLVNAFEITTTKTGRATRVLHHFYGMADGACIAFFEAPDMTFDFKVQHDFDLHIAVEIPSADLQAWIARGRERDMEVRGPSDHGGFDSIYFRDPNGYVVELVAKKASHDSMMDPAKNGARATIENWTRTKPR